MVAGEVSNTAVGAQGVFGLHLPSDPYEPRAVTVKHVLRHTVTHHCQHRHDTGADNGLCISPQLVCTEIKRVSKVAGTSTKAYICTI